MKKGSAPVFSFLDLLYLEEVSGIIRYGIMYGYYICPAFLLYPRCTALK